jgi:hypothetical protein
MTPKDKANKLVDKYLGIIADDVIDTKLVYGTLTYKLAKQCALIAVDEILNNVMFHWYSPTKEMPKDIVYFVTQKKYYEEVKEELEKL